MDEYIERKAALDAVHKWCDPCGAAVEAVLSVPTADVVPVVHGRWNIMEGTKTRRICSKCRWDVPEYGKFYSYCPNCGAKMNGGDENAPD